MTQLSIKNMVCNRCIYMVNRLFTETGLKPQSVKLGEVELANPPNKPQLETIQQKLKEFGFEILSDQKTRIIERIKTLIIKHIQQLENADNTGKHPVFSELLASALHREYSALSKLFSEAEGITIEKYLIQQKIEKVKEWLAYDEQSLGEMADKLGYSSVAHLSAQFKKITGFTPSAFRKQKDHHRRPLDEIGK